MFFIWSFSLLIGTANAYGQKQTLVFDNYTSEQGLTQNSVKAICQDHFGFIWLGTENGLAKFDGISFKTFVHDVEQQSSISSGNINDLVVDKFNNLWIATDGGLNCYNQKTESFNTYFSSEKTRTGLLSNVTKCLFIDSDQYLWVGTNKGLNRTTEPIVESSNTKQLLFKNISTHLSNFDINCIYEDKENNLWVGTESGLNKLDKSNEQFTVFYPFNEDKARSENQVLSIIQDDNFRFWIGTNNGLYWYNEETNSFTDLKEHSYFLNNKNANQVRDIIIDHSSQVFIATYGGGLLQFSEKDNKFYSYTHEPGKPHSLARNYTIKLFEDESKTLFVSTVGKGFCTTTLDMKKFQLFRHNANNPNSMKNNIVRTLFFQNNETIWIGYQRNGLDRFDINKNKFTHYNFKLLSQDLQEPSVKSILDEDSVNLWIGTLEKGLILLNTKTGYYKELKYRDRTNIKSIPQIFDMAKDAHGNLWLATFKDGLYQFNIQTKQFTHYHSAKPPPYHIPHDVISAIYVDKNNRVWFTNWGGGLSMLNQLNGEIKTFVNDKIDNSSIHSNFCTSIFEDAQGILWIGTSVGLSRFDPKNNKFQKFDRKQGLINEFIYSINEDKGGNLWVSTNHGLSKFDKKTNSFTTFEFKDGLQANEFNIGANHHNQNGLFAFGGINGLNLFYPDSIILSDDIPNISIKSLQLNNKDVEINSLYNKQMVLNKSILYSDTIILNHKNNFIGFKFTAHNYSKPKGIKYAYRLDGFNDDWNIVSANNRMANYTNLDPGNYSFEVKSTNADGVWKDNVKKIQVVIEPPFWKTIWFITILVLIVILMFVIIFRLSSNWIINQNKKLESLVEQRTMTIEYKNIELADKITEINIQKEELLAQAEQLNYLNAELEVLSTVATEMKNSLTIMDAKGNLILANKAFKDIYSISFEQARNKYGDNIFDMPFPEYIFEIIRRCFNEKVSVQFEIEYTLETSGSQIWIHTNMTPVLSPEGEIINVIIIDTDITEIKQREIQVLELAEQLQSRAEDLNIKNIELEDKNVKITEQSVELKSLTENLEVTNKNLEELVSKRTKDLKKAMNHAEKANQLKTVFLSNLSHEIRTPMNAICGFSSLMSDEKVDLSTRKKYSKIINDNVDSLLLLVDNIMDLSKLQAKQIRLDNKKIDVKNKLAEIYYMYVVDDNFIKEQVKFELKIKDVEKVIVKVDEKRFKQIFTHLIDNAIKYTEKGSITLAATIVPAEDDSKVLNISVEDTGIGIKKEELNEIFEHFRTIDDKIKLYRGTGLGLAIVQELLKVYKWKIIVESTLGKGSNFTIKIPLHT